MNAADGQPRLFFHQAKGITMLHQRLRNRLDQFLPTIRVGVDFGEYAGGIAIVQGTRILHAETYLDLHQTTLEQRRQLRRGRRTRHAKKMRLARLRSWALRQEVPAHVPGVRLRGGKAHLPDPYSILANRRFWVQPGIYQHRGGNPQTAPSWIERAKTAPIDAEEFLRALTLIFKKRGYKYDDRELGELSDERLLEFLESCCRLRDAVETANALRHEVSRRGKPRLQAAYDAALERAPQPRKAVPRQLKEAELRQVVANFGRTHHLDPHTIERWAQELIGLLNKVLRQTRFDNRLRSGCSWCGAKTPRLKKSEVRGLALLAAVNNLRIRQEGALRRLRQLTEAERAPFVEWWQRRQSGGQFPKGPRVVLTDRSPSRENLERYLESLNAEKRWTRDRKEQWKLAFPMLSQLNDLLNRTPRQGRANLCLPHLKMAADGKTAKDAGVDWQSLSVRRAANPAREQHDTRTLYRFERLLFVPGKRGEEAWRFGPVSVISLEVPEPQTQRVGPRQLMERKEGSFKERLLQELEGQCVYCGKNAADKDHIYPRANGGPDLWDNLVASCKSCNDEKGDRTPFQWFGGIRERWKTFRHHVDDLPISDRKKQVLLNQADEFPGGDPTPFARIGARPRQFVSAIQELFKRYGVQPPTLTFVTDAPHIQRVEGRVTAKLRESWRLWADNRTENFPEKNPWDLRNHAQDAALVAACPPHTWRDRIFCAEGHRVNHEGKSVSKPGLAVQELAPDWAEFSGRSTGPLVRILGRYPVSWKRTIFKQTLWQDPNRAAKAKLVVRKSVTALTVGELKEVVSPYYRSRLQEIAKRLQLKTAQSIPPDELAAECPGLRRLKVFRQKPSGVITAVKSKRGPVRYLAAEPEAASEGVVVWQVEKQGRKQLGLSVIRPRVFRQFKVPAQTPLIPPDSVKLAIWRRHQLIRLPAARKYPEGWYRVKEFDQASVTVLPEHAVTDAIAKRIGLARGRGQTERPPLSERKLGKRELLEYFHRQRAPQPVHEPVA